MNNTLRSELAWGVGILVLAIGASAAREAGHVDGDTVTRIVMAAIGLMLAWFGNRIPKRIVPAVWAQRASRVSGWTMVLSGLVHAGLWAFAPIPLAIAGGSSVVLAAIAVTLGYCRVLRASARAS